jgi:hypothetical protein
VGSAISIAGFRLALTDEVGKWPAVPTATRRSSSAAAALETNSFAARTTHFLGRSLAQADAQAHRGDARDTVRELQEDIVALAEEVQRQRALLSEANERIDFLERALVQVRETAQQAGKPAP